ncbi:MAG: gamma-glutamyltransferase [Melioribacteraceae bacterium]|nr:gamma-glutamyltransferase [Melioribacteraceae bacterium]
MSMRTFSSYLFFIFIFTHVSLIADYPVSGKNGMVVSAHRLASEVGISILKKGGNAVDAAVGVGFALAVVYPYAGNIGGGGFMILHHSDGTNTSVDFRETAPEFAHPEMYLDENGEYLPSLSREGIISVGIPGSVAGLHYAHQKYGKLSFEEVILPAISLARNGFELEFYQAELLNSFYDEFCKYESSKKIFTNNGSKYKNGDLLVQKDLASTLELIKINGPEGFYRGETADKIVTMSQKLDGIITHADLENYSVIERKVLKGSFNDYEIIGMPPPSSGGIAVIQSLNIFENFDFAKQQWGSSNYIHYLSEIFKRIFADRSKHIGDPEYYQVPVDVLISKEYSKIIFNEISDTAASAETIYPGDFNQIESHETTHYSVIDSEGNAVSVTTTINSAYGSKIVCEGAGFLFNNEMDDFSSKPGEPNQFGLIGSEANKIEPRKRMLSSMSPTIVLKNDQPILILGAPGGSTIITSVIQVLINVLHFGMDIKQAVDVPRIHHQWRPDRLDYENFGLSDDVISNLIKRKHIIGNKRIVGRVQAIFVDQEQNVYFGASDKRGFGSAIGY